MANLTPDQQQAFDLIRKLNTTEFSDWFTPSNVMAFCQVESAFKPHAYRFEPRLNEGSYGLMQVLASTARDSAGVTNPEDMYQPEIGLRAGMGVARLYWELLSARLHRDPTLEEWSASYNEGVGGTLRDLSDGHIDLAYPKVWEAARAHWDAVLGETQSPPPPPKPTTSNIVLQIQTALRDGGYDPGPLDGIWGPRTSAALDAWKRTL